MTRLHSRRDFLKATVATGSLAAGYGYYSSLSAADSKSPGEKLNLGTIGTANQARFSMGNLEAAKTSWRSAISTTTTWARRPRIFRRRKNTTISANCSSRKTSTP